MIVKKACRRSTEQITGAPSSESSPAEEVIANNVDILTEILLRVRAKSLIRFKSVSKHWFSLISSSQFSTTHSRRNPKPSISGWFFSWKSIPLYHPIYNPIPQTITHSCNGLLLYEFAYLTPPVYMVCNPTTGKYALIPKPIEFSSGPKLLRLWGSSYLAFDPSKSPRYKVAFVGFYPGILNIHIYIYCSESASWKQILAPGTRRGHTAICGGVIHWLNDDNIVVGFDVYSEKMIKMPNAPKMLCDFYIRYFGGCGGRLILILDRNPDEVEFKILEMDKDYGSWTMECEFHLRDVMSALQPIAPYSGKKFSILSVVEEEEEKGYSLILALPGKVVSYNLQLKTWNVLRDAAPGESICDLHPYATAHPYIESLSPV
ncbi:hypothetical protein RHSIM_Rhsim01G0014100 [Rhododendron simsii]|uniref:F-box associated beta-propeller type 3 domain-containing protein n=1 Tax=Rhododendron simsii TaxID=118357 RepID=A0A834HF84_RHOSS|nr:hypothetical protein RHSIM_Rhsim01G0014100 [Rhododendron simsii]